MSRGHESYWAGGGRETGKSRTQFNIEQSRIAKGYDTKIESLRRDHTTAVHQYEFSQKYPNTNIEGSVGRTFRANLGQVSLIEIYERHRASKEAKLEYDKKSSITQARSEAVKEQEKLDFIIKEYADKKQVTDQKALESKSKLDSLFTLTTAIKEKPQVHPSSYFANLKDGERPLSIIGTTQEKSRQAVQTFDTTESQQQQLFREHTQAKNWEEALAISSRYRESNPYVGTAMTYLINGKVANTQGVLIEKALVSKIEGDKIQDGKITSFSPVANPKETLSEIQTDVIPISIKTENQIPTLIFLDKEGNTKETTLEDMWAYVSRGIETKARLPTKSNQILSNYERDNMFEIMTQKKENTGETFNMFPENSLMGGIKGHSTELIVMAENLRTGKEIPYTPTPEALLVNDLIQTGKEIFFDAPHEKAKFIPFVEKKLKEEGGFDYLLGSSFGSLAILLAPVTAVPSLIVKYGEKVIQPQTIKEASKIASALAEKYLKNPELEKLFEKYPAITEKEKNYLRGKNTKTVPYSVEPIKGHPDKALVTLGTEAQPSKAPYIVYTRETKGNKNPTSKVYSIIDSDTPITPRDVIVHGKQSKELSGGKHLKDDFTHYPIASSKTEKTYEKGIMEGNRETLPNRMVYENVNNNLQKITDPASHLALVGTLEKVFSKELKNNPKEVIESITGQEVKRETVLMETEHLKYTKGTTGEVKNIPKSPTSSLDDIYKSGNKGEAPPDKLNLEIPSNNKVNLETPTTHPPKERMEKLKEFAKGMEGKEARAGIKTHSASAVLNLSIEGLRDETISLQSEKLDLTSLTGQRQSLDTMQKAQTKQTTKQETIQLQREKLITDLTTIQDQKPLLDPRFSLIVDEGFKQDVAHIPRFIVTTKQDFKQIFDVPTETDDPIIKPPTGDSFGIGLNLPEELTRKRGGKKGKASVIYWRDDTDTSRVGRYLGEAPAITVSKDKKGSWGKIDKLQRKTHKKDYLTKKEKAFNKKLGFSSFMKKSKKSWF